ncbi:MULTISPECIES: phage tail protein [unclassified Crossiella]|uniref:phage tail protein n=1 Tax=unclassified Crossiella TaxID=2620835 RepID=UPI001FFF9017|nr:MULTISPECIES: phage tail protein [unclassified Crossiella]MCK2238540.1 phage tail protein [Crossiella sp. S99.2]MCK2251890.1 phage tail protein [Crossiella sp. S99.1]
MRTSAELTTRRPPMPSYRFRVAVEGDVMAFVRVTGLQTGREPIGARRHNVDFTLTRGVCAARGELWDWLGSAWGDRVAERDLAISLTNDPGPELLVTWRVRSAYPTRIAAPSFDTRHDQVAIAELTMCAESMSVEYH